MFCPNKVSNGALSGMRLQLLEHRKHIQHYKKIYSIECTKVKRLSKLNLSLQNSNNLLQKEIEILKTEIRDLNEVGKSRKPRSQKDWHKISTERTKHCRVTNFKDMILATLKDIKVCHREEMSLWLEQNQIQFSFGPSDFTTTPISQNMFDLGLQTINSDHNYVRKAKISAEPDNFNDLNYSEIYDSSGRWTTNHIRKIIHVMDCFRVSHEAYHELRMVSKGHLPPIGSLSKEKKKCQKKFHTRSIPKCVLLFF